MRSISSEAFLRIGWEIKIVDRDINRALLSAYRHSITRYQKLLKTHQTEIERDYIKQRLLACNAAVKALSGPESTAICIWKPKYLVESRHPAHSRMFPVLDLQPLLRAVALRHQSLFNTTPNGRKAMANTEAKKGFSVSARGNFVD